MKNINFKKAIEVLGYSIVKYAKGYNYRTAFATDASGALFYFHIEDLRDKTPALYYRTAKSTSDYTGGINRMDMRDKLAAMGYQVIEPRRACDFNCN